jgi:hypothetical protein
MPCGTHRRGDSFTDNSEQQVLEQNANELTKGKKETTILKNNELVLDLVHSFYFPPH